MLKSIVEFLRYFDAVHRRAVRDIAALPPEADGWARTNELAVQVFASGDAVEGATAFAEKRKPVWQSE